MTKERAKILELLNDRKRSSQSITLIELTNATGSFQYRKVEKILEGLKQDGYLSRLIIRDLDEPITYELTECGCNYQQEIDAEIQKIAAAEEAEQRRIAEAEETERKRKEEIKQQRIHDLMLVLFSALLSNLDRIIGFLKAIF